jgi:hypothetical protein
MSHIQASSAQAGLAAAAAEAKKSQKYADIISGVDFVPVAIETSGIWGEQAIELVKEIGRRIAASTHELRSTAFLRQRLSVAVQRGNAYTVCWGHFPHLLTLPHIDKLWLPMTKPKHNFSRLQLLHHRTCNVINK